MIVVILTILFVFVLSILRFCKRDKRGFDRKGIHKNKTRFDDFGYDIKGYDKNGYDCEGFDKNGYNASGFNKAGYKNDGRNANGKYNRLYDEQSYFQDNYNREGFMNPRMYPVSLTKHVRERIYERMPGGRDLNADKLAREAYAYGKSSYQVMKTSAVFLKEIENRYDEKRIALLYKGYIFIFSQDNTLITMYKNEKGI